MTNREGSPRAVNEIGKVLVVGSTTDYIDWIRKACPGQALFLTAPLVRQVATEPPPEPAEELLVELEDFTVVCAELHRFLATWQLSLRGIIAFDGEALVLAAELAVALALPYPSPASVQESQDKYRTKSRWAAAQLPCPQVRLVDSAAGAFAFLQEVDGPTVLKPLAASGSELVFRCTSKRDCEKWLPIIQAGLAGPAATPAERGGTLVLAEEYIPGAEYSCDFIMVAGQARIIRLTKKLPAPRQPFGTIMAYALADLTALPFRIEELVRVVGQGATALGLSQAVCMVDFIAGAQGLVLLEMSPRPGGDCLPHLLRRARNLDILALAMAYAQQRPLAWPTTGGEQYVGLRLHSRRAGWIRALNPAELLADRRVREVNLAGQPGQQVILPPADYRSWYLGHAIFELAADRDWEEQCHEVGKLLRVEIE